MQTASSSSSPHKPLSRPSIAFAYLLFWFDHPITPWDNKSLAADGLSTVITKAVTMKNNSVGLRHDRSHGVGLHIGSHKKTIFPDGWGAGRTYFACPFSFISAFTA